MKKQITIYQHYIPKTILKNFESENCARTLYKYDKKKNKEYCVNAKDMCKEKYLYEFKNEDGSIDEQTINVIEDNFCCLENRWNIIIKKIKNRKILSKEEKNLMGLLIIIQCLRTPEILACTTDFIKEICPNLSTTELKNITRYETLIAKKISSNDKLLFKKAVETLLKEKQLIIYYSDNNFILSENHPVFDLNILGDHNYDSSKLLFPITPHFALSLINENEKEKLYKKIDADFIDFINAVNYSIDGRFLYSSKGIKKDIEKYSQILENFKIDY